MASKRPVFFRSTRRWVMRFIIASIAVFLCLVASPVLASANLVQQGKTFYESGQYVRAVEVLEKAADTFRTAGDKLNLAMTLSNLSLAYQQLGQWDKAEQAIAQSLDLLQARGERSQLLAQSLDVRGRLQLARGQAEAALASWEQSAEIYGTIGDETGKIRSQINQAQALQALGLYRQAQNTLAEVRQSLQNQPDSDVKAEGLYRLGNVLRVLGQLKQSRQVLTQSLSVAKRSRSPDASAEALLGLGNTARAQQDKQAALAFYRQAADSPSSTVRLQSQLHQLSLLVEGGQSSAAREMWNQVQPQIDRLPPSRTAVYARIYLAQSLMEREDEFPRTDIARILATAVQQAKSLGDKRATSAALGNLGKLYEQSQQRAEALDLTQQALFIAQAIEAPDLTYQWQWQSGRILRQQGDRQGAIAVYSEAVKNLQSLRNDLVAIDADVQFSFREEVEPVYRQLVDLLLQSQPTPDNLDRARNTIEALQLAELNNYFRAACLAPLEQVDFVDEKAAVIYPIILDDRLEVVVSLPGQNLRHYATQLRSREINSVLARLRQTLVLPYTSAREIHSASQQVYNWLLKPAEVDLQEGAIETLVFVLDGSFRNVPMATLYDGERYLIEKYGIALTPGLQLFEPRPLAQTQLEALTAGLTQERFGFSPLEFVERELTEIQSEIPAEVLLDREFTSTTLDRSLKTSPVPIVHIATHGQFSSRSENTFILAWDEPINVTDLDRLLQTRNPNRSDPLELLVLSACETAAGDDRAALGMAGVAVRAGARSTIASLWLVGDESTAVLMSHFYQELKTGISKAEALRRAQLTLLQGKYQHPYFWSAFVLLGNWL